MTVSAAKALAKAHEAIQRRELDRALHGFRTAEALGAEPDACSAGRWLAYMLLGDFTAAWAESDAIRQRGAHDPHRMWQGEDLRGKRVILRCLHGLGDAVQFLRYLPALRSQAASVVVEVPPALAGLAPCFAGVEEAITWGPAAPPLPPEWDVQVEINELPYLFRTTADDLPIATRYVHLPEAALKAVAPRTVKSSGLRVGLIWAGGDWNPSRSIPFELLRPILDCPGCEFWNLQGGCERDRWSELPHGAHLHAAQSCAQNVVALASTIAQLDLIITCDTLAAHLGGALGASTWVALERAADWRWQHNREDSPWYPSLRLFRQHQRGDWTDVISTMASELRHQATFRRMVA